MPSSYPGALDALTNPTATDAMNSVTVPHATVHSLANDAIEAIETELGVNPSGASATVVARLDALDTTVGGKAPSASPTFTGTVTAPLTTAGYVKTTSGGVISSSAAVPEADVTGLTSALAGKVTTPAAWTAWAPSWTSFTPGSASVTAVYCQIGKVVHFRLTVTLNASTVSGRIQLSLPVSSAQGSTAWRLLGTAFDVSSGVGYNIAPILYANDIYADLEYAAGTWVTSATSDATTPFTWADGDFFRITGTYEAS